METRIIHHGATDSTSERAFAALADGIVPVEKLIDARFPMRDGVEAFARAGAGGVLKGLVELR